MQFTKPIESIHFSCHSDFLSLAGEGGIVYIVDVRTWELVKESHFTQASIQTIRFSRHDERLAFGSSDGVLTLLDPSDHWNTLGEIDASDSSILSLDWSTKNLAIGRDDGSITLHEADKVYANFFVPQAELSSGNAPVRSVVFGARGRFLGKLLYGVRHEMQRSHFT